LRRQRLGARVICFDWNYELVKGVSMPGAKNKAFFAVLNEYKQARPSRHWARPIPVSCHSCCGVRR